MAAREAAAKHGEETERVYKAKAASESELFEARREVRSADIRVERVHALLDLYHKVSGTD